MVTGHGLIDYAVVALIVASTLYLLATRPANLLRFLPIFLTVDFFIPLGTQLTAYRLVPPILLGWMIIKGEMNAPRAYRPYLLVWLVTIFVSLAASLLLADSGIRPLFRALYYVNLVAIFVFSLRMMLRIRSIEPAMWGLVYAGALHGFYGIYQIVAFRLGLPFRGIVYSEFFSGIAPVSGGGFRINGLADEPKRLGFVLFAAALALAIFAFSSKYRRRKAIYLVTAAALVILSGLTFSGSFVAALVLWAALFSGLSRYTLAAAAMTSLTAIVISLSAPDTVARYADQLSTMLDDRLVEVEKGLSNEVVYRQEFYAQDYLSKNLDAAVVGLGVGRSNLVFYNAYGPGAGLGLYGRVVPLNSQILQVTFDLSIVGVIVLYGGGLALILAVGRRSRSSWGLSGILSFLVIQSFFVDTLVLTAFVAAAAAAHLSNRASAPGRGNPMPDPPFPLVRTHIVGDIGGKLRNARSAFVRGADRWQREDFALK